jgi:hypothetical protein
MIKRIAVLLLCGVVLSGCGTITLNAAMSNWVKQSNFPSALQTLVHDGKNTLKDLGNPALGVNDLHTVCGVFLTDVESANASLPTPDSQSTNLLSSAYTNLGGAANQCYKAGTDPQLRAAAAALLTKGLATLSAGSIRITVATGKLP